MSSIKQTLFSVESVPLLHLFSLLLLLELVLLESVVEVFTASLARLEVMVIFVIVSLAVLELVSSVLVIPLISSLLFYSLSRSYLGQ